MTDLADLARVASADQNLRHAEPGEVLRLFREQIVPEVPVYERD